MAQLSLGHSETSRGGTKTIVKGVLTFTCWLAGFVRTGNSFSRASMDTCQSTQTKKGQKRNISMVSQ